MTKQFQQDFYEFLYLDVQYRNTLILHRPIHQQDQFEDYFTLFTLNFYVNCVVVIHFITECSL